MFERSELERNGIFHWTLIGLFEAHGCFKLCQRFRKFRLEFKWKSVSVFSDRIVRDHLWRLSTYFGWNLEFPRILTPCQVPAAKRDKQFWVGEYFHGLCLPRFSRELRTAEMARFSVLHRSVIAGAFVVFLSEGEWLTLDLTAITCT